MPFGVKPDGRGGSIDFDAVYEKLIAPAIAEAKLQPLRGDQEHIGGMVHKPMFERLILSDYAVADLTTANANVFYELGVRHAVRPHTTVLIAADLGQTPFDLAPDRVRPYTLDSRGCPTAAPAELQSLVTALDLAREPSTDSPVFSLVDGLPTPEIDRAKTDVFRDQAAYSAGAKRRLADARHQGAEALREVEGQLGALEDVETGVVVDLLISYRAVKSWEDMIRLVDRMPRPLAQTALVREQLGFALNRAGRSEEAEKVLRDVLDKRGPSSETNGLLGRVYKDRWAAERDHSRVRARGYLRQAIEAYRGGFEADWRDAYPGVNAVTLMEMLEPGGEEQQRLGARGPLRDGAQARGWPRRLLGSRDSRRARGDSPRPGGRRGGGERRAGRRPRAVGAREHGQQPAADPRSARGERRASGVGRGDRAGARPDGSHHLMI